MFRTRRSLWIRNNVSQGSFSSTRMDPAKSLWSRPTYSHGTFDLTPLFFPKRFQPPQIQKGRYPPNWPSWRKWVKRRAGYRCERCGRGEYEVKLNAHHITPLSKGGITAPWNLECLCVRCHSFPHPRLRTRYLREHPWESFWYRFL
jgi:5-methylcytosine-specific restriction endonuclease McrA